MAASRPILGLISLIILAAGVLFQFFVILSGTVYHNPESKIYFLQASTTGITPTPRNPSRWTFFAICGESNGHNANCGATVPALPFDPPRNFGTDVGVPGAFIGTHHYYYLSRFMFAFYLIALFFAAIALFTGLLALCTRLGAYLTGFTVFIALFFQTLAASLMTAWTVQGRNAFRHNGQSAKLGTYAYGFTWGAFGCFLVSSILFCVSGGLQKDTARAPKTKNSRSFGSRFGRNKRNANTRGSFVDSESQHRVKDEYE